MPADMSSVEQHPIFSLVPFAAPIKLYAYHSAFANYYPEAGLQTKRWFVCNTSADWVFADIGASVGIYTLLFSHLAPQGHVYAFEPTETVHMLRANVAASRATNVSVHEWALGTAGGERETLIAPEIERYRFVTLDAFVRDVGIRRLDCVKIDVDGFDLEVLQGAVQTLMRFNPWLVIELNHALATRGQSVGEAMLWLAGQGYSEALVLDHENFVLKRTSSGSGRGELRLRFDREPILLPPAFAADRPLTNLFKAKPALHNAAHMEQGVLVVPGPCWANAASWSLRGPPPEGPVIVEVELEVLAGAVGIGCLTGDMSSYTVKEVAVSAAPSTQVARICVTDFASSRHLILRSNEKSGADSRVRIHRIRAWHGVPIAAQSARVLKPEVRSFNLDQAVDPNAPSNPRRDIDILPVSEIGDAFGFAAPYVPEQMVYRHGLRDFNTQIDEPGLFRYLYRHFRPMRHLEFGTWEGFGVVLCAESCDAEIWTVNLPEGQRDAAGKPLYPLQSLSGETAVLSVISASDAGEKIGWRYRAAGFAARVHQMLMDSRDFPIAEFQPGFFDSILIDGGHTPDIVTNDTDKALYLIRSGGLIVWHDFCPEPETIAKCESANGTVRAWAENHDRWRRQLGNLFWLRPSWLLIGTKK